MVYACGGIWGICMMGVYMYAHVKVYTEVYVVFAGRGIRGIHR